MISFAPGKMYGAASELDKIGDDIIISLGLDGVGVVTANGHRHRVGIGDMTFQSSRLNSITWRVEVWAKAVIFRVPGARLFGGYLEPKRVGFVSLSGRNSTIAQAVHDHVTGVLPSLSNGRASSVWFAEQSLINLLAAAYFEASRGTEPLKVSSANRWPAVVEYIECHLADPELDLKTTATAIGVSNRILQRLFQGHSTRHGRYLLERRLDRARAALGDPSMRRLSVSQIAYQSGFGDLSHFSRRFKERYGCSPAPYRSHCLGQT
jgi:AraC-like DNA-binding protein